jgi:hypothetical protein
MNERLVVAALRTTGLRRSVQSLPGQIKKPIDQSRDALVSV